MKNLNLTPNQQLLFYVTLIILFVSACMSTSKESTMMTDLEGVKMSQVELGIRINEFGKFFVSTVEESADEIIKNTDDEQIKMNALEWKINAIPQALQSLVILDPIAAGFDLYALSAQMYEFFKEGNGKNIFGSQQYIAIKASKNILDEVESIAEDFRDKKYREETLKQLDEWVKENPIRNLQFNRKSTFDLMAKTLGAQDYDIGSTVGSMAEGIHDIRRQITFYTEFMPKHVKWQVEFAAHELLGDSALNKTFNNFDRIVESTERITLVAEQTPALMKDIQLSTLTEVNKQLLIVLNTLSEERKIILTSLSSERRAAFEEINKERLETLDKLEQMTKDAINHSSIIADNLIDKFFIRLLILLIVILVGAIITVKVWKKKV
ncbi:MAG: hypothetical protein OQK57_03745 [Ignavibacteriaceae bacterium]|nr:hypothetical protein [Ignavibacteriaceae bacterium]